MTGLAPKVPAIMSLMEQLAGDTRPVAQLTPEEARARMRRVWVDYWNVGGPRVETMRDTIVETDAGHVPVRIYDPDSDLTAAIVYIHGGGFVTGDLDTDDTIVRRLALYSGRPVVSVHYRRAPENPYPLSIDDCVAVCRVVARQPEKIGLGGRTFGIAGTSAGAHLALATALRLRDEQTPQPAAMLLMIGNFDPKMRADSYRTFGKGYLLELDEIRWGWQQYVGNRMDPPPYANLLEANLANLPPAYIGAAGCDPLVGDSVALAEKMTAAGGTCRLRIWPGMIHACVAMARHLNAADHQLADAGSWIAHALRRSD